MILFCQCKDFTSIISGIIKKQDVLIRISWYAIINLHFKLYFNFEISYNNTSKLWQTLHIIINCCQTTKRNALMFPGNNIQNNYLEYFILYMKDNWYYLVGSDMCVTIPDRIHAFWMVNHNVLKITSHRLINVCMILQIHHLVNNSLNIYFKF